MFRINSPIGDQWHKWDLHCHTPVEKQWYHKPGNDAEKEEFAEKYVQRLIELEIKVIAIKDHYDYRDIRDGYFPKIKEKSEDHNIIVLPGWEIKAKDFSGIHLLVIFPESMDLDVVQKNAESLYNQPRQDPVGDIPMSKYNVKEIYEELRSNLQDDFIIIFSHIFNDKGLLHERGGSNRVDVWKYDFIRFAQWSKNPKTTHVGNFKNEIFYNLNPQYKRTMAHIAASDCHSLEPIPESPNIRYLGQNYTWFKTAPNFEGLKHIFTDSQPEYLIRYDDEDPRIINKPYFSTLKLGNNQLFPKGQVKFIRDKINLNSDMITIIGSRGTGKSLLLTVIGKLHDKPSDHCENIKLITLSPDFEMNYIKEDKEVIRSTIDSINELDYIHVNQSEVKKICKNPIDMNITIRGLLRIPEFSHSENFNDELVNIIDKYFELKDWFEIDEHDEDFNLKKVSDYEKKIDFIKTSKSKGLIEKLRQNQKKLRNNQKMLKEIDSVSLNLDGFKAEINLRLDKLNTQISDDNMKVPTIDFGENLEKLRNLTPYLEQINKRLEIENQKIQIKFSEEGIEDIDFKIDQVKNYEDYINHHQELLNQIAQKKAKSNKIGPRLIDITMMIEKNIKDHEKLIQEKWENLKNIKFTKEEQNQIHSELLDSIEIKPSVYFNVELFISSVKEFLNKNKFRKKGVETTEDRILSGLNVSDFKSFMKLIKNEPVITIEDENITLLQFIERAEFFNNSERDFLTSLYKSNSIEPFCKVISITKFKGKEIETLSMGERGTLFLRLKLATGAFSLPFIFDQPEDDLDNEFIQNTLVPLFRRIKQYRQVLIVTKDANLVVNSNAEQIIIAKNENEEISYICGSIGDPLIRTKICDILEGGERAFQRRAMKYGLTLK